MTGPYRPPRTQPKEKREWRLLPAAVNMVNKGSAAVTFAALYWWVKASDGSHYIAASANDTLGIKPGPVQSGSTIKDDLYFEIPSASTLASLYYKPAGARASGWQQWRGLQPGSWSRGLGLPRGAGASSCLGYGTSPPSSRPAGAFR
jgi:hypothetical protein